MVEPCLSLKELLRICFPGSVRWICEETEKQNLVSWVVTSLDEAQVGDILIIAGDKIKASIFSGAENKNVSGILILGDVKESDLEVTHNLPIAVLKKDYGQIREVQRILLTTLTNQRLGLVERSSRIYAQLSQLEAEGKGVRGLVDAISRLCGKGVLLQDKRGEILADCPSTELTAVWKDVLTQFRDLSTLPDSMQDRKQINEQLGVKRQQIPGQLTRLIVPIIVSEVARGYLSIIALSGDLDTLDYLVAEQGGLVCGIEMARKKAIRETEKRLKGDLLHALLQDEFSPRDALLWVQNMGLDKDKPHIALRFAWDSAESPSRRRLETIINGEFQRSSSKYIVHGLASEVVCFYELASDEGRPEDCLRLAETVLNQAHNEYPKVKLHCGIGNIAKDMENWRSSFRQAGQALEMARRLWSEKPLYYSDMSVYRLLFQLEHSPELIAFQDEILGTLLASENAGEMIHTLEAYFEHNTNLSQAAEALFIHRNTLIYRLERFGEITHLDLSKPEDRLAIQLALRIFRMTSPR
ncbi:MAG: helix-turn-helix domain-containing protein [Anaerolineales bacterium]|nr:helix-turn-helix domain-containing protein [Anaerolineales bacterium]